MRTRFRGESTTSALGVVVIVHAFLLLIAVVLAPPYRAPDEPQHVSTIVRLATTGAFPPPGDVRMAREVAASQPAAGFRPLDAGLRTYEPMPARPESLPSFRDLRAGAPPAAELDQMTQHPPTYYALSAVLYRVLGLDDRPVTTVLTVLRAANALLVLPLPLLAYALAAACGLRERRRLVASWVAVGLPQSIWMGSAVGNGSLLVLAVAGFAASAARAAAPSAPAASLATAAACAALAASTKFYGLACLPVLLLVALLRWRARRRVAPVELASVVLGVLLGSAWWLRNLVLQGTLQPLGDDVARGSATSWARLPVEIFAKVCSSLFYNVGWLETPLPSAVTGVAGLLLLVLIVRGARGLHAGAPAPTVVVVLLASLLTTAVVAGPVKLFVSHQIIRAAQGRYLLPLLTVVAVLVAANRTSRRLASAVPLVPLAALGMVLLSFLDGFGHFWGRTEDSWAAFGAWSIIPLEMIVGGAAASLLAVAFACRRLARTGIDGGAELPLLSEEPAEPIHVDHR